MTLQLEEGKSYYDRIDRLHGPVTQCEGIHGEGRLFKSPENRLWYPNGRWSVGREYDMDLVREAKADESQAPEPRTNDAVNHPPHYTTGKIEVIDAIEDWNLDFHAGNVVKYVARHQYKGAPLQDLEKARWYLDRLIALKRQES